MKERIPFIGSKYRCPQIDIMTGEKSGEWHYFTVIAIDPIRPGWATRVTMQHDESGRVFYPFVTDLPGRYQALDNIVPFKAVTAPS